MTGQTSTLTAKYLKQIEELKAEIKELETKLLKSRITEDIGFATAKRANEQLDCIQKRNQWLEERNAELENPKGSHYTSLSWPGRIILCIRKMKRPLRFQEVMQELTIMEGLQREKNWLTEKGISVTLSNMAKDGRLHSSNIKGTRGNFYALNEWVGEDGKLNEKMSKRLL